jgi:hypothetical protein
MTMHGMMVRAISDVFSRNVLNTMTSAVKIARKEIMNRGQGEEEHDPNLTMQGRVSATRLLSAPVVEPFGNVLGVTYNPHYLEVLGGRTQS